MTESANERCPQCKSDSEVSPYVHPFGVKMFACGRCFIQWRANDSAAPAAPQDNRNDTMEYWRTRATAAELKLQEFSKLLEAGPAPRTEEEDGEFHDNPPYSGRSGLSGALWLCYHALKASEWRTGSAGGTGHCVYCGYFQEHGHDGNCMVGNGLRAMEAVTPRTGIIDNRTPEERKRERFER